MTVLERLPWQRTLAAGAGIVLGCVHMHALTHEHRVLAGEADAGSPRQKGFTGQVLGTSQNLLDLGNQAWEMGKNQGNEIQDVSQTGFGVWLRELHSQLSLLLG